MCGSADVPKKRASINETKYNFDQVVAPSPILNLRPGISILLPAVIFWYQTVTLLLSSLNFCFEKFNSPLYYMSGATKPYENIFSGCTDSSGDGSYLIDVGTVYGCPSGYTSTIDNDDCIQINVTGATSAGTFYTVGWWRLRRSKAQYVPISSPLLLKRKHEIEETTVSPFIDMDD